MRKVLYRIYSFLGFTRRERNASLFVIVLVLIVITYRFLTSPDSVVPRDITSLVIAEPDSSITQNNAPQTENYGRSDPNTATEEELIASGFSERQARTLINFRSKGGRFKNVDDLLRVYGVNEYDLKRIGPNIYFETIQKEPGKPEKIKESGPYEFVSVDRPASINSVSVNVCDSADLVSLPGIGPVFAARILKYRDLLGGFINKEQLLEVYGLSDSTLNKVAPYLIFDSAAVKKIPVNSAEFGEMIRHPYLGRGDVSAIIKLRELSGPIKSPEALILNRIISAEKLRAVLPYLDFNSY